MCLFLMLKVTLRPSNVQAYIGLQQVLTALRNMQVRTSHSLVLDSHIPMHRRPGLMQLEPGTCFMAQRSR